MVQTLSSRRQRRRELSVLLAQSATPATLSPAPCASCWPNRGRSGVMRPSTDCHHQGGCDAIGLGPCHSPTTAPQREAQATRPAAHWHNCSHNVVRVEMHRGHVRNMAGISRGGMMEQSGAPTRWDTGRCHQGKPLVVTKNSLLPRAVVLPSTYTCCQRRSHHLPLLLAPGTSHNRSGPSVGASSGCQPQLPLGASPPPPAPEGLWLWHHEELPCHVCPPAMGDRTEPLQLPNQEEQADLWNPITLRPTTAFATMDVEWCPMAKMW
ncbi:hypothetical protein QTO34_016970 [Cnephaeus nilssonii]|uniref:Uncharacterized protein n=1 Tax=Cnephaeus nilssonii TaxID=3371016 RepID=A0AA40LSC0_CNENI|nr:hypothetical protein QTO34_016970 [Eptesicus nilssonii]